jgi:hypothetical protein
MKLLIVKTWVRWKDELIHAFKEFLMNTTVPMLLLKACTNTHKRNNTSHAFPITTSSNSLRLLIKQSANYCNLILDVRFVVLSREEVFTSK